MFRLPAAIFAVLTLLSTVAPAQEADDNVCPKMIPAGKRARKLAGKWFVKGEQATNEARFQEALDDFLCSLHIYPHQNTVFNVAQLTNLVRDKALATASLKKFREEHPTSEFDDELSDLIISLENSQGIAQPEKEVEEAPPEPAPRAELQQEIAIAAPSAKTENKLKSKVLRISGFVAIASASATIAVGIVLQALAGEAKKNAESSTNYDMFRQYEDDRKSRQNGATAMYVVTGVLAGAGTALVIFGREKKETKGESQFGAALNAAPGSVGMTVTGRF